MPVVSKGEFTVSRLDDGVSSHLHVGWLMADGTFTTEYPGENLLLNSSNFTSTKNWGANDGTTISVEDGCLSVYKSTASSYRGVAQTIPVPEGAHGKRFRLSTTAKGASDNTVLTNGVIVHYLNGSGIASQQTVYGAPNLTTEFQHLKYTYATVPEDTSITKIRVIFKYDNEGTVCHVLHKNFKLAFEDSASIYTPAPTDDYLNAYPKYRGEYTDTIEADSTDPTKYTWTAYLGEQGPPTGVISQNTVPSSPYVGMLWQCTGNIAGYINPATYRWNGSAWEIYQFTAQNIMADTFTGFTFQGVKMIASEFISHQEFDRVIQPAPESIIENHVTDISIADGRLLIETNVDTKHDLSAGVKWTDQVHMETTVDDTLGFIIDGTRRWGQDGTTTYSALVQNSEFIALLPNSRDAMSEKDMVTNNNWRNVVATKHCGRQLWDGGQYMTSSQVVTPMVKMSDCLNGWLLQWQRYNPGVGLDSSRYFYQPISKLHPSGKGITTYISAPASATDNGGVPAATKYIYVTDTTITGYDSNSVSPGNNWALSGVFGW